MLENDAENMSQKIPELFLKFCIFFSKLKTSLRSSIYLFLTTASIKKFILKPCTKWNSSRSLLPVVMVHWLNEWILKNSWCVLHKII